MTKTGASSLPLGDLRTRSAFQPVYSLAHGRAVGHEALLRALDDDGVRCRRSTRCGAGGFADLLTGDRAARRSMR